MPDNIQNDDITSSECALDDDSRDTEDFAEKTDDEKVIQENDAPNTEPSFEITETEWAELKNLLDKRYAEISALLRYNKTKDESIQRLGAEIQKYRDGFAFSALKPFINALITMREDCRKSLRDAKQFNIDEEKAKKYIDFLVFGFEEMLSNTGLERDGDSISINKKPISEFTQPKKTPQELTSKENRDESSALIPAEKIKNTLDLIEYLNKCEAAIRVELNERTVIDRTIGEYIALAAHTDAEHYLALAAPAARQLYKLYDKIAASCVKAKESPGNEPVKFYHAVLEDVISGIEVILAGSGMEIETPDSAAAFDAQKHKLLKTIMTNDEKLDRTIANIYTDCYIFEGKVIYQSKADIYKFQ